VSNSILPTNEHPLERGMRVLIGLALLSIVFVGPKSLWGLVGIVPLLTGVLGSCPVYTLLGLSTCPVRRSVKQSVGK
jgi:Protein of unknown function (DUF2892)